MNGDIRQYFTRVENAANADNENQNFALENIHVAESVSDEYLNTNAINETLRSEGLEYEIIPGQRKGSNLVYLINEKNIFKPINGDEKYGKRYICSAPSCMARIIIRPNGTCERSKRSKPHLLHSNHSLQREEYIAVDRIKQTCSNVDALCGGSGLNVSVKTIFDNETIR